MAIDDGDRTLADTRPDRHAPASPLSLPNYDVGDILGKGGMGEVLLAKDPKIGREVAIKRMVAAEPSDDAVARFLREAKIQACLEHPAIVPVHEIGHDAQGRPFFTMKRLAGTTLHELVPEATLQRMLRALVDVCLAIELAHTRGVVHRDLKPSNIMLGNFGEVYVLDWGVARVVAEAEARTTIAPPSGETQVGDVLGTPGYMAPEQIHDATGVTPAADVYSLGCILYEILVREPLHPRGLAALASTLAGVIEPPSVRSPDVPPELDAACVAALAKDPAARPTARELGDRIQAYLDGDRDLERRKILAAEYLATARAAAEDPAQRADAMRAAGRAVGLDPNPNATAVLARIMLEPLAEDPPDLTRRLAELDRAASVQSARGAPILMLSFYFSVPLFLWAGVTSWPWLVGLGVYITACLSFAIYQVRSGNTYDVLAMFLSAALCIGSSRVGGPFIFVPVVIVVMLMSLGQQAQILVRSPLLSIGVGVGTFLAPVALEAIGVFEPSFVIGDDKLTIMSSVVHLGGAATYLLLIVPNLCIIAVAAWFARGVGLERRAAQRVIETRAWHLQQLVPKES